MKTKFKKGDKVVVINATSGGEYFVESRDATVVRQLSNFTPRYKVLIDGEECDRFIDVMAQSDPDKFVFDLNAAL